MFIIFSNGIKQKKSTTKRKSIFLVIKTKIPMKKQTILLVLSVLFLFSCKQEVKKEVQNTNLAEARSTIIDATEINNKIQTGEDLAYGNTTINGDIDFTNSKDSYVEGLDIKRHNVKSSVTFVNCTFKGKISAFKKTKKKTELVNFNKNITFINCTFQDTIILKDVEIKGITIIQDSEFQKNADFRGARFNFEKNYLNNNKFLAESHFNRTVFIGEVNFMKSVFEGNAHFQLAKFKDNAQFGAVKFMQSLDFTSVKADEDLLFHYAEFKKKAMFNNSVFKGRTEFISSVFNFISQFNNILFYGPVKYNNSKFIGVVTFENSKFILSPPQTVDVNIPDETDIILKNSVYLQKEKLIEF